MAHKPAHESAHEMQALLLQAGPIDVFAQETEQAQALVSPYTILVKALGKPGSYYWVAYSIGKIHNIIWGRVKMEQIDGTANVAVAVEYGCDMDLKVLNAALKVLGLDGYAVVSTIAMDKATPLIHSHSIADAYMDGMGYKNIAGRDLQLLMNDILRKTAGHVEYTKGEILEAAEILAQRFMVRPNLVQYLASGLSPDILEEIHRFIEYHRFSTVKLPEKCLYLDECKARLFNDRRCRVYRRSDQAAEETDDEDLL